MNYSSPKQLFSFIFLVLSLSGQVVLQGEARLHKNKSNEATKLFVFGDSYVDAGNSRRDGPGPGAWKEPYGMTYPGKPAGRYSDGRVFSDYVANYVGLDSPPVPYELRKERPEDVKYGMNFASGGTGVFYTSIEPNMTTQIDHFENMIKENVYTASDLDHSLAYVSVAGNDYVYYLRTHNNSPAGIISYIPEVIGQIKIDLLRIYSLGVKKVAIGRLHPVGCIPGITINESKPFQECNEIYNVFATYHNVLLVQALGELNKEVKVNTAFVNVDLYASFDYVINNPEEYKIHDPLIPCCVGIGDGNSCGSVDEKTKEKKYKVCDDPTKAFFWDLAHPTQAGWHAVYSKLKSMKALKKLKF